MIGKLLYGGGFFLLLTLVGWVVFYRSSPSENEEIKQEFKKNGFSYSLFLKVAISLYLPIKRRSL